MISILLLVWGDYGWLVKPWKEAWKRVWPEMPEVQVTDWPPKRMRHPSDFSRLLREELVQVKSPVVLLSPVDTFPTAPLLDSLEFLYQAAGYIVQRANVVRFGFLWESALAEHGVVAELYNSFPKASLAVYRCDDWSRCSGSGGMLMDTALWNRAHLVSLLQDGWAIEQVESIGGDWMHAHRPDLVSMGLVPGLFRAAKLVHHFQPRMVSGLEWLDPRDEDAVRAAMPAHWKEAV